MIYADIYPLKIYKTDREADIEQATYMSVISKREEVISDPDGKSIYITYSPEFIIRYGFSPKGQLGSFIVYTDLPLTDRRGI